MTAQFSLRNGNPRFNFHFHFLVLGLAGMELIFSIAACMMQCFGFVLKIVLVTHQCFHCCWTVLTQHWAGWGGWGARVRKRTEAGQLTPAHQRDIPHAMMACSAIKAQEKEEEGGHLWLWCLSSTTCAEALLPKEWLDICLPMKSGERVPYFAWSARAAFTSPLKLSLSWFMSHLAFFLFSSPFHGRGEWRSSCVDAWLLPGSMLHTYIVYLLPCK